MSWIGGVRYDWTIKLFVDYEGIPHTKEYKNVEKAMLEHPLAQFKYKQALAYST